MRVPPESFVIREPVIAVSSAVVSRLCLYLALMLVARLLPAEEFGAYALLLLLTAIVNALASGGGDMWLNRFTLQTASQARRAPRVWRVYLLTCLILSAACIVFTSLLSLLAVDERFVVAVILAFVTAGVTGTTEALLAVIRAGNYVTPFFLVRDLVAPLLQLGLIAALRPSSLLGMVEITFGVAVGMLVVVGLFIILNAGTLLPVVHIKRNTWRWVVRHTSGMIAGNLASRLALNLDVLLVTFFVTLANVGEYRVAVQFAIGFTIIQHFFFLGLPWQIRHLSGVAGTASGYRGVHTRQRMLLALSLAGLLVMYFGADLVLSLFGERFVAMTDVFRILLILRFVELLWGPQHEILVSRGEIGHELVSNLASIVVWLVLFIPLLGFILPLPAALAANVVASLVRHGYRALTMARRRIPPVYGQPLGIMVPLAGYAVLLIGMLW